MQHQVQRYCPTCEQKTLFAKHKTGDGAGCLLLICTGGLALPILALAVLLDAIRPYRCQTCGTKRR